MASKARLELATRIRDVDELILAHEKITGGGQGRPANNQGAAITRAGIVLLAAANEAFVEDLFEEAALVIFATMDFDDIEKLFKNTTKRMNTANCHTTEMLFFNLGMPWVLRNISWKKFSNEKFRENYNRLTEIRGSIAHGRTPRIRLQSLRSWKTMVETFSVRFEQLIANNVASITGQHPGW